MQKNINFLISSRNDKKGVLEDLPNKGMTPRAKKYGTNNKVARDLFKGKMSKTHQCVKLR